MTDGADASVQTRALWLSDRHQTHGFPPIPTNLHCQTKRSLSGRRETLQHNLSWQQSSNLQLQPAGEITSVSNLEVSIKHLSLGTQGTLLIPTRLNMWRLKYHLEINSLRNTGAWEARPASGRDGDVTDQTVSWPSLVSGYRCSQIYSFVFRTECGRSAHLHSVPSLFQNLTVHIK